MHGGLRAFAVAWTLTGALAAAPAGLHAQELTGGVYLFRYQPLDLEGAAGRSEVYAAFLRARLRDGPWELYLEPRARDDRLRPYFPGNVWFQEAWAAYHVSDGGPATLRILAGKTHQTTGRFWDGSFFGNLQYFDGLKLNPQWLLEASGDWSAGIAKVGYELQYIMNSDRISGALAGRDFETLEGARDQDGLSVRTTVGLPGGVRVGATFFSRGVRLPPPADGGVPAEPSWEDTRRILHVSGDLELRRGPLTAYAEWLHRGAGDLSPELRRTIPGSPADYLLAGGQWNRGPLHLRYNASRAHYLEMERVDWIQQPGVTWELSEHVSALAELDLWTASLDAGAAHQTVDRSLDLVLLLTF